MQEDESEVGRGWRRSCPSLGRGTVVVQSRWVRRLTEPQQSQDAAWDIDRLEPEGSCRIGTTARGFVTSTACLPPREGGVYGIRVRGMKEGLGKNVRFHPPKWLKMKDYEKGLDMALICLGYVGGVRIAI